jgi:penicillin-binding protein 1C
MTRILKRRWLLPAVILAPLLGFVTLNLVFPLPVDKLQPRGSTVISDRNGELLRVFLSPDEMWRMNLKSNEISSVLKKAVLAYEDRYFYYHPGINPYSIARAAIANIKAGRVVEGGSTITMQVARLIEPKERTLWSKIIETFRAAQLELHYSKDEILTFYFNLAPYGGNVVGAGAASYLYFDKPAARLSVGEAALLAAIPNSPNEIRPDFNNDEAEAARERILDILLTRNENTEQQYHEAMAEPVPRERYPLPFEAPHLANYLMQERPAEERLQTTIDARVQRTVAGILKREKGVLASHGISNAAAVVIDNKTCELISLVGSIDFFDEEASGQVDGALAPRSPGSALKPFVYALAIGQGLVSPQSLLADVPQDYSGYRPQNYDDTYHGAVTVEDALIRSLNVPAVNLYAQLGSRGLYSFLKLAGVTTLPEKKEYYGLPLVLGGGEVNLLELSSLYSGLASGGRFSSCRILLTDPEPVSRQILSEGACYIITDILSRLQRPELPAVWEWSVNQPKVAWKTGTSYGHRDAWSIGYTPQYTVGVWAGNFDGKGARALVGAEIAAPILFDIFTALEDNNERWFAQPESVRRRRVCAISGLPMSPYCDASKTELYLPGISPQQECNIHRCVLVDDKSGYRLCPHCREGHKYHAVIYEQWPPQMATWMERNGYSITQIPAHNPKCTSLADGDGPVIYSPLARCDYKLRPGVDLKYQKILLDAKVSNSTANIYWFLDHNLIYSGPPTSQLFVTPTLGSHELICMDDEGRSATVTLNVVEPQ